MKKSSNAKRLAPGAKFGRWTIVKRGSRVNDNWFWEVECECGVRRCVSQSSLVQGASRSCGCLKRDLAKVRVREKHHLWKGTGRTLMSNGYVMLTAVPADWPNDWPSFTGGGKYEHCYVMARHLGRWLYPGETVHHKNGNKSDNRLDNLELKCKNHGPGQSIPDLVRWAKEILQRYDHTCNPH